jgi:tetratricopeptide (TPR) repeat protein
VASALSWGAIGAAAGVIGLLTAIINHRTARLGWRKTAAEATAAIVGSGGKTLLPSRTHFINRAEELEHAVRSIDAGEMLLVIEGEVRVGKSAVATELAHRLRTRWNNDRSNDDHTFLWIDGRNGPVALADICRPLSTLTGNQLLSVAPDGEKLEVLRAHMATNRTVLVLDNLRLSGDANSAAVREFVDNVPSGSLVIAAVSNPGVLKGVRLSVGELKPSDAAELIKHEIGRLGLREAELFGDAFAERLIGIVGGNPGLIEWFLRALSQSSKSVEESFSALERGEGLVELLDPVWQGLSGQPRLVLGACAHLDGKITARQVEIALDMNETDTHAALDQLISVGLLKTVRATDAPNVFTCAHAVQLFALAQTTEDSLRGMTHRLATRYSVYFAEHWEDAGAAIPHVDAIHAVLDHLFLSGDDEALQRLVKATLDLLFTLGLFDDRISWGALSYESAERAGNYRAASLACSILSSTHAIRGELAAAEEALALGLLAAEQSGLPNEVARQRRDAGFVRYRSGAAREAIESVQNADELARAAGDLNNLVDIIDLRMSASLYIGAFDDAEAAAHEQLRVCSEIPWERPRSNGYRHLAEVAIHRGEFTKARELLTSAREIAVEFEDVRGLARIELTEARRLLIEGEPRHAAAVAARAQAASQRLGLPPEQQEARAIHKAARRAAVLPPLRAYYRLRRPWRLTSAPVAGD